MVFRKALKWWHILTTVLVIAFAGLVIYLFSNPESKNHISRNISGWGRGRRAYKTGHGSSA